MVETAAHASFWLL